MLQFSSRQRVILGFGIALVLLSFSLNQIIAIGGTIFEDDAIYWNNLEILPSTDKRISSQDDAMLVVRSLTRPSARLTLFTREIDDAAPKALVEDLCGRDSCVYTPLKDEKRNGAVADYRSVTPLRIVLMHPLEKGIWLEYKGPPDDYEVFSNLIDHIVTQIREQAAAGEAT